ncbi:hypothetical protein [Actinopolymorpha pittospori]|uniref:Uncharacterized protein n=1 Tax=Actinopolymorpha pittospori TaxID=648752 RepID=A0A927MRF1_9ACTN|nr:hypothetical protein [Actinopolymorpha pittospori]MBE1605510.1 hypothetical protein [Actinopolymorpha pittospori]
MRATQFFELMNTVVFETSDETTVRLPSTRIQPIATDVDAADVDAAVVEVSTARRRKASAPLPGTDGPEDEREVGP